MNLGTSRIRIELERRVRKYGGLNMNTNTLNNKNIKLAIQKDGRLTDDTIRFLRRSGLEFASYKQKLFSVCRNFPLEILYVRSTDIPYYVSSGVADLGIIGQNIIFEERPKTKELFNLQYGFCSLILAVPNDSAIQKLKDLSGKTIATKYPNSTKDFFIKNAISVNIVKINGSVEIAPALGIADAIIDLTSTGRTLAINNLRILATLYKSQATLIANKKNLVNGRKLLLEKLIGRFASILSAKNYTYETY